MELNTVQRAYEKVLPLFDKWYKRFGEPTREHRRSMRESRNAGMVFAEYQNVYGTDIELSFSMSVIPSQGGNVLVRVELKMLRNLPGDDKLSRGEREDAYYDRRMSLLEDARVFLYCQDYENVFAVEWEEIEGYVNRIVPFYMQFLAEEGKEVRSIPVDSLSYEMYRKEEEKMVEENIKKALYGQLDNNYRLEN